MLRGDDYDVILDDQISDTDHGYYWSQASCPASTYDWNMPSTHRIFIIFLPTIIAIYTNIRRWGCQNWFKIFFQKSKLSSWILHSKLFLWKFSGIIAVGWDRAGVVEAYGTQTICTVCSYGLYGDTISKSYKNTFWTRVKVFQTV